MKSETKKTLVLFSAPLGVIAVCFLTVAIGVPVFLTWPDIQHQWTLDGVKEFELSSGYTLSASDKLLFCDDSRGGWHGDGTLNVHIRTTSATINAWILQPFKQTEWSREFRRPEFGIKKRADRTTVHACYWAKWGGNDDWRLIVVQPETGDVWYTEYKS